MDDTPYRSFCDKFAKAFIPRYQMAVQQCKKINETGAQQLLLDVQSIKAVLLSLPTTPPASDRTMDEIAATGLYPEEEESCLITPGGDSGGGLIVPKAYTQFVTKELQRLELMVKIVASPKDKFAGTIRGLWPGCQEENVKRFLEMKDMSKTDQDDVLRALGFTVRSGALPGLGGWGVGIGGSGVNSGAQQKSGATSNVGGSGGGAGQQSSGSQQQPAQQQQQQQQASRMLGGMGKLFGAGKK